MQLFFDRKRRLLMCLSADNKLEAFTVNVDKPDSILKKLMLKEKKQQTKSLKRTHSEANEEESKQILDKDQLQTKIEARDYEFVAHFKKQTIWVVDPETKARAFTILPGQNMSCIVSFHNNHCIQYDLKLESDEQQSNLKEIKTIGDMTSHQMAIRGVVVSPNDAIFATHSFDCLKVWTVDLYMSN